MIRFISKRLLNMIPTLRAVIRIVTFIMDLTPGSPALAILGHDATTDAVAELNVRLGFDKPLLIRYFRYVINLLQGDMGVSYRTNRPVVYEVLSRFPTSIKLAAFGMVIAILIGIPLGILSAVRQYSKLDITCTSFAMFFASMPGFWFGMMAIIIFSLKLGWLPSNGIGTWKHYILPSVTLALAPSASILRLTRTTMLETIRQDYVRTARAKGQTERKITFHHALKNALLPVVTYCGVEFGLLMGGIVTIETVFSINGLGSFILEAINRKDYPVTIGGTVIFSATFMLLLLLVDVLYAVIDPRIRAQYKKRS